MTSSWNMRAESLLNWLESIVPPVKGAQLRKNAWLHAIVLKIAPTLLHPTPSVPATGTIEIFGDVRGSITCDRLIVAPGAKVQGDIDAKEIVLKGHVMGNVKAHQIVLHKNAALVGEVVCQYFCMKDGAYFDGSMRRTVRVLPPALINAAAVEEKQAKKASPKRPARRAKTVRRPAPTGPDDQSLEVLISNGVTVSFSRKSQQSKNAPSQQTQDLR